MKYFLSIVIIFFGSIKNLKAQELYVFSEPASTMPARSVIVKESYTQMANMGAQNFNTQVEFSLAKKWMVHVGTNFKAADFYSQYRFYSNDAMYKHTRLAWYFRGILSPDIANQKAFLYDGQQSLLGSGIILTRLQHKWASSLTMGVTHRKDGFAGVGQEAFQYSFSNGWLLYPKKYETYDQTNFNFYIEILGQKLLHNNGYYLDIAPAFQFIFNSQSKLNLGYRFALDDPMKRPVNKGVYISYDYLFFNALPKLKK
jgi:hypothetical protein